MTTDYRGKELCGESFKGEDLRCADFSGADLRGCDFSGAQLQGATFCNARFGHVGGGMVWAWVLQLGMGAVFGLVIFVGIWYFLLMSSFFLKHLGFAEPHHLLVSSIFFALLIGSGAGWTIHKQRFFILIWGALVFSLAAGALAGTVAAAGAVASQIAVAGAIAKAGAIAAAVAAAGAVVVATVVALVVAVTGAGTGLGCVLAVCMVAWAAAGRAEMLAVILICAIFPVLGMVLANSAGEKEADQLAWLRRWQIWFAAKGASDFTGANLGHANFSNADLGHTCFTRANLTGCQWKNARNLHLAQTWQTLLESRKIRSLMVTGSTFERDFAGMDLAGGRFAGMNLQGCDFSRANLASADFSGSDLTGANLTQATVVGTLFNGAILTAACIQNWKIDPHTQLKEVICTHVFLGPDQNGAKQRNPPEGQFQSGEFAKRYQQIAYTIDFVAHSRRELDALVAAIEQIKAKSSANIFVQNLATKEDLLIITIKGDEQLDVSTLYTQLKQAYDKQLALAENTINLLSRQNDSLLELLKTPHSALTVITTVANHMDNSKRTTNMIGNTISHAAINLGDHTANQTNITPAQQDKLAEMLVELRTLIAASNKSPAAQADALRQTETIADVAAQNGPRELGLVRSSFISEIEI